MKINLKILGTGCSKCKTLEKITTEVVKENNFDADIQKVEDITQIMSYGIMMTPALVVNEKVVFSGRVPSKIEIKNFIEKAIS
ncbi:MAG: thioredoxin family protein [Bacteroidales bacterium]